MFVNCPTEFQAADIFTKYITDKVIWNRNLMLIGHFKPGYLKSLGAIGACPGVRIDLNPDSTGNDLVCAAADLPYTEFLNDRFIRNVIETNVLPEHKCHFASHGPTDRTITEFCCGPNSRLGRRYKCSEGCRVIRITEGLDANSTREIHRCQRCYRQSGIVVWINSVHWWLPIQSHQWSNRAGTCQH